MSVSYTVCTEGASLCLTVVVDLLLRRAVVQRLREVKVETSDLAPLRASRFGIERADFARDGWGRRSLRIQWLSRELRRREQRMLPCVAHSAHQTYWLALLLCQRGHHRARVAPDSAGSECAEHPLAVAQLDLGSVARHCSVDETEVILVCDASGHGGREGARASTVRF